MANKFFVQLIKKLFYKKKIFLPKQLLIELKKKKFKIIETHKNNTGVIYLTEKKLYKKFSINKEGANKIKDEIKGINWYQKRLKSSFSLIKKTEHNSDYSFIDSQKIKGSKIKSWKELSNTYPYLLRALKHYKNIFDKKKLTNIHGDLTLDNIFFSKKNVFFFDWEFFGSSKKLYGYDLAYLFLSSICLPVASGKNITKEDELYFEKLWKLLAREKINSRIIRDPFNFFSNTIKSDKVLKESYKISKKKFFPFLISYKVKKQINQIIKKSII